VKIGVSSYSLYQEIKKGMSILDVMEWVKEAGGEHVEIVQLGFDLTKSSQLADEIRKKAEQLEIELSNYAIGANFIKKSKEEYRQEIERVKREVDLASVLGVKLMRHDVAARPIPETSIRNFHTDLPALADACREIADYAKQYSITTSVENHGYYIQASDRVQLLVELVGRKNFRTTLDAGNFLCIDEDPLSAVKNNIRYASMVHIKDFYYRQALSKMGEGWFTTKYGNYLKGAIAGDGDLNMRDILKVIKESGYSGYLSIEFEGLEDCRYGTKTSLENVKKILQEI
jgi:sugar phosphate isomerase/epimerase